MMGKTLDDYFWYVNRIQSSQSYLLKGFGFVSKEIKWGENQTVIDREFPGH